MQKLFKYLNQNLADLNIFYVKLHQFHWLVQGKGFFTLHAQFEKTYEFVHDAFDEIAERIVGLEGKPVTTTKEYLELAKIKELEKPEYCGNKLVGLMVEDLKHLAKTLKETINVSDNLSDVVTSDMLTTIVAEIEKQIWMYRAYFTTHN